ncbi:hypothetical protein [Nigerium massiliense]|uniref:hypothetical protein n=1 Tax=Nigerium massiliense TaxID=1522317 RepID=UPI0005900628|nr:hypothetical protein [Nigerium massiliense]
MKRQTVRWAVLGAGLTMMLAGCAGTTASPREQPTVTVTVESSPSPTMTAGRTSEPAASGSATKRASRAEAGTTVPIGTEEEADFVSPSGRIWCGITRNRGWCMFPDGMDRTGMPSGKQECRESFGDYQIVEVSPEGVTFQCGGDPGYWAEPGGVGTRWAEGRDVPIVDSMVSLPYGWTLASPRVLCTSARNGVTARWGSCPAWSR